MRFARIEDGRVAEIITLPDDLPVEDAFHPDVAKRLVPCADTSVVEGWTTSGGGFSAPPAPQPAQVDLPAYAATRRYEAETGGIEVAGSRIATDRGSQALINGAFNLVQVKPGTAFKFKADEGFVDLDAAAVQIIAVSVGEHVQACFAKEAEVLSKIDSGAIKTVADVDAAFASLTA